MQMSLGGKASGRSKSANRTGNTAFCTGNHSLIVFSLRMKLSRSLSMSLTEANGAPSSTKFVEKVVARSIQAGTDLQKANDFQRAEREREREREKAC
jgi:hypothetical protein